MQAYLAWKDSTQGDILLLCRNHLCVSIFAGFVLIILSKAINTTYTMLI